MIGLHAERVSGEPRAVRWVMLPPGALPAGRVRTAPGRLGEMFAAETLTSGLVEHTAVWLWLRDELSWSTVGPEVAAALRAALEHPGDWVIDPDPGEVLYLVTNDLLDGSVGDFIRSHGGSVAAERAGDDVAVTLGGACARCAAADHTLHARLLEGLRGRFPDLVASGPDTGGLILSLHP